MTFQAPDATVENLKNYFLERNDLINRWGNVISTFQGIPGLVGFWPMSSVQRNTGNVYDLSGQGRTLTYNGNPTFGIHNSVVPFIEFDGSGDYLSRADEAGLDVTGGETFNDPSVQGLTIGGWFWANTGGQSCRLIYKGTTAGDLRAYGLYMGGTDKPIFQASPDGASFATDATASATITEGNWYFIVGRFTPSSENKVFVNYDEIIGTNTTGISASIFNSSQGLAVGGQVDGTTLLNGRAALCFLSANALPDAAIFGLFEQTRGLFGV